ncbi:hypothetical protein PINS_up019857 [Pythium insidiosum]|nr:hypothetical protein PINS_up019857 [Pythium insidiosum]
MSMRGWEGDGDDVRNTRPASVAGDGGQDGANAQNEGGAATKVATTRRKRQVLSETHLLSDDGLKKIYSTFHSK